MWISENDRIWCCSEILGQNKPQFSTLAVDGWNRDLGLESSLLALVDSQDQTTRLIRMAPVLFHEMQTGQGLDTSVHARR